MIVIRKNKKSKGRVILSNVLYVQERTLEIIFYYNNDWKVTWDFKNKEEVDYCLDRIDEILDNNTFGSFVIMKDKVEPIPSSY